MWIATKRSWKFNNDEQINVGKRSRFLIENVGSESESRQFYSQHQIFERIRSKAQAIAR